MNPMNETEVQELVELAESIGLAQEKVATHMEITGNYWFKIRSGRAPLTSEVLKSVRRLKKKLKAFTAA